jgi:hypothetical protein
MRGEWWGGGRGSWVRVGTFERGPSALGDYFSRSKKYLWTSTDRNPEAPGIVEHSHDRTDRNGAVTFYLDGHTVNPQLASLR